VVEAISADEEAFSPEPAATTPAPVAKPQATGGEDAAP
jgi:hypothetical protein